ncbi:MAG: DUF255 domain-containing protein [Bacteroidota bacterium]
MKKIIMSSLAILITISFSMAQKQQKKLTEIQFKWYTIEEATNLCKTHPKKIFIDIYTDWCGWCTKMTTTTFSDSIIKRYMALYYYPVKFNAEQKDTIAFNGNTYVNPNPNSPRSSHQLAISLLKGQMSYPSFIILNEKLEILNIIKGYRTSKELEPILHYFAENAQTKMVFEKYVLNFKGSFN